MQWISSIAQSRRVYAARQLASVAKIFGILGAMSQENLEVVWDMARAFNRRDLEGWLARISPDVEWDVREGFPGAQGIYRGQEGARRWWSDFMEAWESFHGDVDRIAEGEAGQVFIAVNGKGRGSASGVETELEFFFVAWVADGKIARFRMFQNREQAAEVAGLRE